MLAPRDFYDLFRRHFCTFCGRTLLEYFCRHTRSSQLAPVGKMVFATRREPASHRVPATPACPVAGGERTHSPRKRTNHSRDKLTDAQPRNSHESYRLTVRTVSGESRHTGWSLRSAETVTASCRRLDGLPDYTERKHDC